jgi:large subunit ribosomal protein L13
MKTTVTKQNQIEEKWYVIDAEGQRIGRVATIAAELLLGKNNVLVRANLDPKVKVVVINSSKLDITPKRGFTKFYRAYSGFPGGLRYTSLEEQMKKNPNYVIEHAVKGMLPKTRKGDMLAANLKIFATSAHKHEAQQPEVIDVKNFNL